MKNDTRNKRRRRRPRNGINAIPSKVQDRLEDDPVVIQEEPRGPVFDDSATEQNIYEKIEISKNNGWGANVRSFFGSNGGIFLPIGVLVIAIALAFGAIQILEENDPQEVKVTIETEDDMDNKDHDDAPNGEPTDPETTPDDQEKTPESVSPETPETSKDPTPTDSKPDTQEPKEPVILNSEQIPNRQLVERTNSGIEVVALAGDGITHLARRAVVNQLDYKKQSLNDEQMVYAEDYLQNRTGNQWIEIGQVLEFDYTDVDNSIESAQQLQDWQIQNLMQYTQ